MSIFKTMLTEEATLFTSDGFKFMIFPEPLGNPSFHLSYKNEWIVVLQIKDLSILEVKHGYFSKNTLLPNHIMKKVELILYELEDGMSRWELLLRLWNNNINNLTH